MFFINKCSHSFINFSSLHYIISVSLQSRTDINRTYFKLWTSKRVIYLVLPGIHEIWEQSRHTWVSECSPYSPSWSQGSHSGCARHNYFVHMIRPTTSKSFLNCVSMTLVQYMDSQLTPTVVSHGLMMSGALKTLTHNYMYNSGLGPCTRIGDTETRILLHKQTRRLCWEQWTVKWCFPPM